ncbi:hypothetical protein Hanom_Chr05g00448091 [Helianthus anomalus]
MVCVNIFTIEDATIWSPPKPTCHLSVNHHHTTGDAPTATTPPKMLRPPPSIPSRHPRRPPSTTFSMYRVAPFARQ